ncbi:MAG: cell wall assembly regulator SMI1 [Dokdonia donghaensis]|jgi:cell wall assembly regulator SMI1
MTITEKIEHISKWTAENFEKEVNEINIGSGENDFAQIEKMVSEKLPKEFVEVYSKFNGEGGNQYGILFGLEFISTKKVISNLDFALSLVKPTERKIINQKKAEEILNGISELFLKSIPNKKKFGLFSKKWEKASFNCSHESYSGVMVKYENGQTENFKVKEKYSDKIFALGRELHQLEQKNYNWDSLEFDMTPDGKFTVERKDYVWEDEIDFSSYPKDKIKKKYFHYKWLPIFHDFGGNFIGIDLDPDINGVKGQFIIFGRDEEKMIVLADSFDEFLDLSIKEMNENPKQFISENHIHEVYKQIKNCT